MRDLLLRVQALAETKWEEGSVRQCTQIYTECAMALLKCSDIVDYSTNAARVVKEYCKMRELRHVLTLLDNLYMTTFQER